MRILRYVRIAIVWVAILGGISACMQKQGQTGAPAGDPGTTAPESGELKRLSQLATTLRLDLGRVTNRGTDRNMIGLKSDSMLFSRRSDSRTYFVEDKHYGEGKEHGIFHGPDSEVLQAARSILQQLGVPSDEIAEAKVLTEKLQTGRVDPGTKKIVVGEIREGKKTANLTRQVKNVPIFTSHARIGLTSNKSIGFMELHWPEIDSQVVREAQALQGRVKSGWRAPQQKGAQVEAVEAGIIHSPALGFMMDVKPVIRVIYSPDDKTMGRKLMLYVDTNGKTVSLPRQFERLPEQSSGSRANPKPSKQ